jgi:EmrB/QacA subfamily drug resistance transporter
MSYKWKALSVTTLGALLASIQGSSLLLALPQILVDLKTNFIILIWIILIYLLATTMFIPIIGKLADIIGKKFLYNLGFIIFTIGSLLSGLSQSSFHGFDLLFYRLIQGIGGALLFTNSTAIVTDAFSNTKNIGLGLGINQIATASGFIIGPILGGLLVPISWRLIFFINIPIGIIGSIWGIITLKDIVIEKKKEKFDYIGSIFLTLSIIFFLLSLSFISLPKSSSYLIILFSILFIIFFSTFLIYERNVEYPIFDFSLFKNKIFAYSNATGFLNSITRGAGLFILIFFLQGPYGKSPFETGLMIIPFGLSFLILSPISGYLSDKYSYRVLSTLGLFISAIGLLGLSTITKNTNYLDIAIYMSLLGAGSGLFSSPNTNSIMQNVKKEKRGEGSAIRVILANLGQMLSIAIIFPIVLGGVSEKVVSQIFIYGEKNKMISQNIVNKFTQSIHLAFIILLVFGIITISISLFTSSRLHKNILT